VAKSPIKVAIRVAKGLLSDARMQNDIAYVHANFGFLCGTIGNLEKRGLRATEVLDIVNTTVERLSAADGDVGKAIAAKFSAVLAKNTGLRTIREVCAVLRGNANAVVSPPFKFSPKELACYRYAPLVSCEVERSFSQYKSVLRDNRQSFLFENLRCYLIIHCNRYGDTPAS
jgi:hypothetical protein